MKSFTVKRSEWARGNKNGSAMLLNNNHCMCCLGFAMCQLLDVPKEQLLNIPMPARILKKESFLTEVSMYPNENGDEVMVNSHLGSFASSINDDESLTEQEREQKLIALFAKKDIVIEFVD